MIYGYSALIVRYLVPFASPTHGEMSPREEQQHQQQSSTRHAITHRWDFYDAFYFNFDFVRYLVLPPSAVFSGSRDSCREALSLSLSLSLSLRRNVKGTDVNQGSRQLSNRSRS